MRDYLQQRLLQLLCVNRRNEPLPMQMLQQSSYLLDRLHKARIVIAKNSGNYSIRFFKEVFSVTRSMFAPTYRPGVLLRIPHVRKCRSIFLKERERHIQQLFLQFSCLSNLIFDRVEDVLLLHEAIIVDEVYLLLEVKDRQLLERHIEDENRLDGLSQKIQQGVLGQLQIVLIGEGRLLDD